MLVPLEPQRKWRFLSATRIVSLTNFRRGSMEIIDEKPGSGAYDCFKLTDDDKGDNAQNYAWLAGVSTYYLTLISEWWCFSKRSLDTYSFHQIGSLLGREMLKDI